MERSIQKRNRNAIRERSQYGVTLGIIAMMLFVAGFPTVVIFFFGIFAYFLWKTFSAPRSNGSNQIFDFYIAASSILRDDERKWFGFEVQETIAQGERVLQVMHGAPPLVYFALGALYNKAGNHERATKHLSYVVEESHAAEASYVHPSVDLRNYVRILRTIEREPSHAPHTAKAIRNLERIRKHRGGVLLAQSSNLFRLSSKEANELGDRNSDFGRGNNDFLSTYGEKSSKNLRATTQSKNSNSDFSDRPMQPRPAGGTEENTTNHGVRDRKPITELLHDIYDDKEQ